MMILAIDQILAIECGIADFNLFFTKFLEELINGIFGTKNQLIIEQAGKVDFEF